MEGDIKESEKRGILFGGVGKKKKEKERGRAEEKMAERLGVEGSDTWRWRVGGCQPRRKNTSQKRAKCAFAGPLEEKLTDVFLLAQVYIFTGS